MISPAPDPDTAYQPTKAAQNARCVTEMRACWHREVQARARGDSRAAEQAKRQGDLLFYALTDALNAAFAERSWRFLKDPDLIPDGVHEQILSLYEKLHDLSDSASARGWEMPLEFWVCFRRHASNLFLRRVQRAYGKEYLPAPKGETVSRSPRPGREQKQTDSTFGAEESSSDPISLALDPAATATFTELIEKDAIDSMLEAISDPRHRQALQWDCDGVPQAEIARLLGASPKTVYNYIKAARADAVRWARSRHESHGEYGEWIAPPPRST